MSRGRVVVVAGPDGSGKSSVADELRAQLPGPILHIHHRPRVLPARPSGQAPPSEPHRDAPYAAGLSLLKALYLYADYLLGWVLWVRPVARSGGSVVVERGWWDLVVDPRRYRLHPSSVPLVKALGRLLPRPDATLVMVGDAQTFFGRKRELPAVELQRQMDTWRALVAALPGARLVDADRSLAAVVGDAVQLATTASRR